MTKGKKWTLRLLGVAVLALLVSLCFMGSTMARYTSSGNGSGSLTVALWDVETVELSFDGDAVSPSDDAYTGSTRENTSAWVGSFTIQNNSDVDAYVSFVSNGTYTIDWPDAEDSTGNGLYADHDNWEWGKGWIGESDVDSSTGEIISGRAQTNAYGAGIMEGFGTEAAFEAVVNQYGIFTLTFGHTAEYLTDGGEQPEDPPTTELTDDEKSDGVKIQSKYSMDIYAEVVWTSIDSGNENADIDDPYTYGFADDTVSSPNTHTDDEWEAFSDAVDTILGMYAQKLTFGVTWTAVQASKLPAE